MAGNFPVEVFFLRDDDIPEYVQDGVAHIGFVGENVVKESNKQVEVIEKLGFGKCRLSIAVPKNGSIQSLKDLEGKRIATSYPFMLSLFLNEQAYFVEMCEATPKLARQFRPETQILRRTTAAVGVVHY